MMIVIQKTSGVAVMRVLGNSDAAECLEKWKAVNEGDYVSHAVVDDDQIPADRSARDRWALVDGSLVVLPA